MRKAALLVVLSLASCGPPQAEIRHGPAYRPGPMRVVCLPAQCASVEGACDDDIVSGATGVVRSALELAGYSVVEGETLVKDVRSREEANGELRLYGERVVSAKTRVQAGAVFEDLGPAGRRALLAEARAEGLVVTRVQIGARQGFSPVRDNEVFVRLGVGENDELGWIARCSASSGFNPPVRQAVETAARCAIGAATGRPQ